MDGRAVASRPETFGIVSSLNVRSYGPLYPYCRVWGTLGHPVPFLVWQPRVFLMRLRAMVVRKVKSSKILQNCVSKVKTRGSNLITDTDYYNRIGL